MSDASQPAHELLVERLLDAFDRSWRESSLPPQIASFIADGQHQGVPTDGLLQELVHIDLEYRWKFPERARLAPLAVDEPGVTPEVTAYQRCFPSLQISPELLADVARLKRRYGAGTPAEPESPPLPFSGRVTKHDPRVPDFLGTLIQESVLETPSPSQRSASQKHPASGGMHPADPRSPTASQPHVPHLLENRYQRIAVLGAGRLGKSGKRWTRRCNGSWP